MASRILCVAALLTVVCGTGCRPDSLPERAETVSTPKRVSTPAAGGAKVSLAETLAETEHIVIIVNTVEDQPAQQLTLRKAEVRELVTATRASLRPTTRATGYPPPAISSTS